MKTVPFLAALACVLGVSVVGVTAFTVPVLAKDTVLKPAATSTNTAATQKGAVKNASKTASKTSTQVVDKGFSGELTEIAKSNNQWTGIAVSKKNRVFVSFPRWSDSVPVSVGELLADGSVSAFPDKKWNEFIQGSKVTGNEFVCAQAVYTDSSGSLWIVDPAAPRFQGPIDGGPKLVKVNLNTNKVEKTYPLGPVAPNKSYLNDVRIDTKRQIAYLTDSGLGAIVVLDLKSGAARRLLADSPSTKAEDVKVVIDGKRWGVERDGSVRKVHSDGIALDKGGDYLYYQALTGKTLYRVATKDLRNEKLSPKDLNSKVEKVATTCIADGIEFGADGILYITSLEDNSIKKLDVNAASKKLEMAVQDKQLVWPDSIAVRGDGFMYVTCSQINLGPKPATPYKIFRFKPAK